RAPERYRRREAARVRDELRAGEPVAEELGEPVDRLVEPGGLGVLEAVPAGVRVGGEPEVTGEIDHDRAAPQEGRRQTRARPVRERGEDEVRGIGHRVRLELPQRQIAGRDRGQVWMDLGQVLADRALGAYVRDLDRRVGVEETHQYAPGESGGAEHGSRQWRNTHDSHKYAWSRSICHPGRL